MGQVTFSTTFSGGNGNLDIDCSVLGQTLNFDQSNTGPQTLTFPIGHQFISVTGAAPTGTGGNIALSITGALPAEIDQNFLSGFIPPHTIVLFVTS